MHDQENGLGGFASKLFLGIFLVLSKASWLKGHISWLVDTVDISKGGSDGKHVANLGQPLVDSPHLLGACVKLLGVN